MNDLKRLPFLSFYKLEIQGFLHLLSDWGYRDTVRGKREEREGGGRKGEREEREGEREREMIDERYTYIQVYIYISNQFSSVQSLSCVQLFATP